MGELLRGWGRSTRSSAAVDRPNSVDAARSALTRAPDRGAIGRGLGRSYADQATNAGGAVLDMTALADPTSALTVPADGRLRVAAGTSIHDLLAAVVPQGWFVPVTPGTRYVTIGGALAADIHGKNHHADGTIAAHVDEIELLLTDGALVTVGPERDAELFWATTGGMGLTGIISAATLRLVPIETSTVLVDTLRLPGLEPLLDAMVEADATAHYSVAWIDLLATGSATGRSVLTTGDFATAADLDHPTDPLPLRLTQPLSAPPLVPDGLLRPSTVRPFNEAWFRAAPRERRGEQQSISRFFHPLDGVKRWNHLYGRPGFLQWQVVVPDGAEDTLRQIVGALSTAGAPSFLAVLKRFGPANPGPLSFPMQGWTLAADFPAGDTALPDLLDQLDRMVAEAGGRLYLAKDGRMDPTLLPLMYPDLDAWREVRARVDPDRRLQSDLARRLHL